MSGLRRDADDIIRAALQAVRPGPLVEQALEGLTLNPGGKLVMIALGKAAWPMARAALLKLGERVDAGLVIVPYGHSMGKLPRTRVLMAGHPVPDAGSIRAARAALALVSGLGAGDTVLFLLSGGGSALFELPRIGLEELQGITHQLLKSGCSISEANTLRKRLSLVKGGGFARACVPAKVLSLVLSDVLGDPLDLIASGPAVPDTSTAEEALQIVREYQLDLSPQALAALMEEPPKNMPEGLTRVIGNVSLLCEAAAACAGRLSYRPRVLTTALTGEARQAGAFLGRLAEACQDTTSSRAFILGGETVVKVRGNGKGGRNQEVALAAAPFLARCQDTCLFSLGSDGRDGPTDAAGGYVDGQTLSRLQAAGVDVEDALNDNNAYPALQAAGGLLQPGPTLTNVNDLAVLLIKR